MNVVPGEARAGRNYSGNPFNLILCDRLFTGDFRWPGHPGGGEGGPGRAGGFLKKNQATQCSTSRITDQRGPAVPGTLPSTQ